VGFKKLLAAVQKADGLGPLLAGNFTLVLASYCDIIEHVGWASYMKAGSWKTHERLHKKFLGFPTQEKVNQLIRSSIAHQMLIGEHKAEKVVCLGLQKMSDKATCKDVVVVRGSSISFLKKKLSGVLETVVLDYSTKTIHPYQPLPFGCNTRAWATGRAKRQLLSVIIPARTNFDANAHLACLVNLKSLKEWPLVVEANLIKSTIHIGGFFIVHPELPQFTEIKDGNIPKPYTQEVMKGRNIVVLIVAASMKAATGNIVCILILQLKTIYIFCFEPLYFSPSKFVRFCSAG
jgi:hypothetical protein